jgi:hypothetical protein
VGALAPASALVAAASRAASACVMLALAGAPSALPAGVAASTVACGSDTRSRAPPFVRSASSTRALGDAHAAIADAATTAHVRARITRFDRA